MIEAVEADEKHVYREGNGATEGVAMTAKKGESAEVMLFENSLSSSINSGNSTHAEVLYVDMGELEIPEVHGSVHPIERYASNGELRYLFIWSNFKYNMRIYLAYSSFFNCSMKCN